MDIYHAHNIDQRSYDGQECCLTCVSSLSMKNIAKLAVASFCNKDEMSKQLARISVLEMVLCNRIISSIKMCADSSLKSNLIYRNTLSLHVTNIPFPLNFNLYVRNYL